MPELAKKFTVKRSGWVNGDYTNRGCSCLRNSMGFKCCVGFLAEASGLPTKGPILPELGYMNRQIADKIYSTNDRDPFSFESGATREGALTALFKEIGIEVQFED